MTKTILITGSTDGIGLETAKALAAEGHTVLLHGRSQAKMESAKQALAGFTGKIETYLADLSDMAQVEALARDVSDRHDRLDVLINNAGIFRTPQSRTASGLDIRFAVNTIAPYLLTQRLLPLIPETGRVVNLSSAAQAPVDLAALAGQGQLDAMEAYAQSKLALTIWTTAMAAQHPEGPVIVSVNPGSYLATKMVKEGFGMAGNDISQGSDILVRAALSDAFAQASGKYFDNDAGRFAPAHPAGQSAEACAKVVTAIENVLADL
jgi:NAD(P)-dependent dehydrogenase (short-subunit alcohol dehydrogenase family)